MSRRTYLDTSHGQLHARVAGDNGPNLVLLHESPLSSFVYEPLLPLIAPWCQALALDTLGYGQSDAPGARLDIPGYAEPVAEIVRGLDGPTILVGSHTGASIAIEVARQAGSAVDGLVLLGIATYTAEQQRDRLANWAPDLPLDEDGDYLLAAWNRYRSLWSGVDLDTRATAVWTMLGSVDRYNWAYNSAFEYEPLGPLAALRCPVLTTAAEGEFLEPGTRAAAERLGLPYEVIPGIQGQPAVRSPELLADLLQRFSTGLLPADAERTGVSGG